MTSSVQFVLLGLLVNWKVTNEDRRNVVVQNFLTFQVWFFPRRVVFWFKSILEKINLKIVNTSPSAAMASSVSVLSKSTIYSSIELAFASSLVEDRKQLGNEILMPVLKYHNLNYFYKNVCFSIFYVWPYKAM